LLAPPQFRLAAQSFRSQREVQSHSLFHLSLRVSIRPLLSQRGRVLAVLAP